MAWLQPTKYKFYGYNGERTVSLKYTKKLTNSQRVVSIKKDVPSRFTMFCSFPQAICVKDASPNIQSCQLVQDGSAVFKCKGELLISLDTQECDRL